MTDFANIFVNGVDAAMALLLLGLGLTEFVGILRGGAALRRQRRDVRANFSNLLLKSPLAPGLSVIATPRSASAEEFEKVRRLLNLHFGRHEAVVVLDGPTAEDMDRWIAEFRLVRHDLTAREGLKTKAVRGCYVSRDPVKLLVVEKESGGVEDAMRAGINVSRHELVGFIDRDAEFVQDWALRLLRPMLEMWDSANGVYASAMPPPGETFAGRVATLSLLRRRLKRWSAPLPGSCMIAKREAAIRAGGRPTEDIRFVPDAVSWPRAADISHDVPARLGIEVIALGAMLPQIGRIHPAMFLLVLCASAGLGIVISMAAAVSADTSWEPSYWWRLFLTSIPENAGYRQVRGVRPALKLFAHSAHDPGPQRQ